MKEFLRRLLEPFGPTDVDEAMTLVILDELARSPWFQERVRAIQRGGFTVAEVVEGLGRVRRAMFWER